jgi:probable rRNA maturation factor
MLNIENLTTQNIDFKLLETISNTLTSRDIDITICNNQTIQQYNLKYRQIDSATDVLSFPIISEFNSMPLGSIIISIDKVLEKSKEFRHSIDSEFALLFIHGVLHLLGYDHEIDSGEMRAKEIELIKKFNLPKSLIVRTNGEL